MPSHRCRSGGLIEAVARHRAVDTRARRIPAELPDTTASGDTNLDTEKDRGGGAAPTAADRVYGEVKERIIQLGMPPGHQFTEASSRSSWA